MSTTKKVKSKYDALGDAPGIPKILETLGYDKDIDKAKLVESIWPFLDTILDLTRWSNLSDIAGRNKKAEEFLDSEGASFWPTTHSSRNLKYPKDRETIKQFIVVLFYRMLNGESLCYPMTRQNSIAQCSMRSTQLVEENNQGHSSHATEEQDLRNRFSLGNSHDVATGDGASRASQASLAFSGQGGNDSVPDSGQTSINGGDTRESHSSYQARRSRKRPPSDQDAESHLTKRTQLRSQQRDESHHLELVNLDASAPTSRQPIHYPSPVPLSYSTGTTGLMPVTDAQRDVLLLRETPPAAQYQNLTCGVGDQLTLSTATNSFPSTQNRGEYHFLTSNKGQ
ncbi:hypothetical protein BGZ61DRAFT_485945 [Ilyonectria robusta]|uniref:uncharacterized protein n=1 Tax=Ilyonectria robusta TaxID=1079257 RepID=UPI001E8D10ED|nr:uncharacterized protein BGZ61DRAFT_485945 [Ilyonectria robusta]KAH8659519.1 hypothetical protein BGZ61DRAFT_485945 [Ilyonectria robusta]